MIKCYLVDNNSHALLKFKSKKALKEYAKKEKIKVKSSPFSENSYYIEDYVVLPTEFRD